MRKLLVPMVLLVAGLFTRTAHSASGASGTGTSLDAGAITTTITLKGLHGPVKVLYDQRGIPYIQARDDDDLYFAQGYVVARDRLWQMDLIRRTGRGQLAEIFGREALDEDQVQRPYGFGYLADQSIPKLESKARAAVDAYTRGVNAFIESLDEAHLPIEFRLLRYRPTPWQASDCVILGKVFAETLTNTWRLDLVRGAFAGVPDEKRDQIFQTRSPMDVILTGSDSPGQATGARHKLQAESVHPSAEILQESSNLQTSIHESLERIGFYAEGLAASNNWVVNGSHSVTGKPLLANDPHLDPSAPSIWYMVSLSAPGIHSEGVTVPGSPGINIGHNDRVAWGITNVEADVQDLFLEKFDDSNPTRYLAPDGWHNAETRHEEIKVRKTPTDPATEIVGFDVTVTRHGPIILNKDGKRYALAWPALDPSTKELEAFYELDRARDCKQIEAALNHYIGFPMNFVYADVDGHIGWWAQGRYPIRKTGHGTVPQEGWTGSGDWIGYIPPSETPHVYDPASGLIVTANNRTVGSSYPYYLGDLWAPPYRSRRIYELLSAKPRLSVDDFERIQGDTYSIPGDILAGEVAKLAKPLATKSAEWADLLKDLGSWDCHAVSDSRGALIFTFMRRALSARIIESAFGPDLARQYGWTFSDVFVDRVIKEQPKEWLPKEYDSYADLILACYKQATEDIKKRIGSDESKWTFGNLAKVSFPHPLAQAPFVGGQFVIPPFPQNGGSTTINRGSHVSMRFIADVSNWDNTRQGIPLGESGDPKNPHWADQLNDWKNVTPGLFPFSQKAVEASSTETVVLSPPRIAIEK
jgi:penicillin amidase